jgi:hypothetical protein
MKTKQAMRKNTEPNIPQKLPILAMQNPTAEITNKIQPMKLIVLLLMVIFQPCPKLYPEYAIFTLREMVFCPAFPQ